ncbi:MAG: hypothetical protein P0Y53_13980 [Candidatus Pseudobacter hemicellulosilyticus]|uniref:Uncharacterized protein n=1 Tax=Candidatus Pseudobacter hemicellulosilyticus TaxID=3121375 RepID=A0AAJ5WKM0_9BACT|nr:MAG: hypothetical protein P0Y53_13980 [Pseudobacter sp.]
MEKDKTYKTLKRLLEAGSIEDFEEIVEMLGKTNLSAYLGIHYYTFSKKVKQPEQFQIDQVAKIAALIGVEPEILLQLIMTNYKKKKKK